jgi:hypothetical protein
MAVSCPAQPYKRICSPASITTFACMFGVAQAPASCQVRWHGLQETCMAVHPGVAAQQQQQQQQQQEQE